MLNEIEKKLKRYSERSPYVDITALSEKELQTYLNESEKFMDLIYNRPEAEALAFLNSLEEQDDFIESLERAERELQ